MVLQWGCHHNLRSAPPTGIWLAKHITKPYLPGWYLPVGKAWSRFWYCRKQMFVCANKNVQAAKLRPPGWPILLETILVGDTPSPRTNSNRVSVTLRAEIKRCHDHSSIVSLCLNFLPARSAARNMNWFPYNSNWMFGTSRTVCTVSVVSDEVGGGSGRGVLILWDGDNVE